jgi:hypothetical protein
MSMLQPAHGAPKRHRWHPDLDRERIARRTVHPKEIPHSSQLSPPKEAALQFEQTEPVLSLSFHETWQGRTR